MEQSAIPNTNDNMANSGNPVYHKAGGSRRTGGGEYGLTPDVGDNGLGKSSYLPLPPRQKPAGQREG